MEMNIFAAGGMGGKEDKLRGEGQCSLNIPFLLDSKPGLNLLSGTCERYFDGRNGPLFV
jgi:hypothetical protein